MKDTIVRKIEFDDYTVEFEQTPEMEHEVFEFLLKEYFKKTQKFEGEVIMDDDYAQSKAPEVLADLADRVINFKVKEND